MSAGKLVVPPAAHAFPTRRSSDLFKVRDDGGIANSGVDLDPTANTITVDVARKSNRLDAAHMAMTDAVDGSHTNTQADFGFSDANDSPANIRAAVKITTLPAAG